jgi:hypothetical protein
MYPILLASHSLIRWLVLASLLYAIIRASRGWLSKRNFTAVDDSVRHWTATIVHIQFLLGLGLYLVSPIVDYFLHHFQDAVHQRELRFFGMEHSVMMFLAVTVISIGSGKAKRETKDAEKFKIMAIWFAVGLLIILTSVPWPFSPFTSRPYFRPF